MKLHHDLVLPGYDISVYVDGNILIKADLTPLIEEFQESGADIALFPHSCRGSINEEIPFAIEHGKVRGADVARAQKQLADYRVLGLDGLLLTQNSILFRRHNCLALSAAMEECWGEMERYVMRDQFAMNAALFRNEVGVHYWDWDFFMAENMYFFRYPHLRADANRSFLAEVYRGMKIRSKFVWRDRALVAPIKVLEGAFRPSS